MRPLLQAVSKVKMFNKILNFASILLPLWVPIMFEFPHSSDLVLKCITSHGCCLLVFSGLMFHVNTCCDFLPVEDSMRCTSQTPAKFGVCYRIAELTMSIKLIRIHVLIYLLFYICCNGSSVDPKSHKCNKAIPVVGEGNLSCFINGKWRHEV